MATTTSADAILLSCEHGGNRIPSRYARLFTSAASQRAVASHRGWDPGALEVAQHLRRQLGVPLTFSQVSRLLVDLNRSASHAMIFSEFSTGLETRARNEILRAHYLPHRRRVELQIHERIARGQRVVHVAIHSFSPRLDGVKRNADIGLLYDPRRLGEKMLCAHWRTELRRLGPTLRLRSNYPYRGNADGMTTAFRKHYDARDYLGIEVEINQALLLRKGFDKAGLAQMLGASLLQAQASTPGSNRVCE